MILESLLIGLVLGFLFYELVGVSPGGVIAPGYLALFIHDPPKIISTVVLAVVVWFLLGFLGSRLAVYGKRKLLVALLLGFCLKLIVQQWIEPLDILRWDIDSIGYLIPGLIANEMSRQEPIPTLSALGVVTVAVYLVLLLLQP
ncbi:MAG: poly-gamma-glutamate biosynthesis protein PgsC [Ignavibacteria bacterium]|nr:poly-gamma-glutamate biosynthesis protein PgsC [Ignavibacteria bacterium]